MPRPAAELTAIAIAPPPPAVPIQADFAALRAAASASDKRFSFNGIEVVLEAPPTVKSAVLKAAISKAVDLSDLVRTIGKLYAEAGFPAAQTRYARSGDLVYIRVENRGVARVDAPRRLRPFFRDLPSVQPLTSDALEADRALADSFTEHTGDDYKPQFFLTDGGDTVLDIGQPMPGRAQTETQLGFNDSGNRYSGRYLAQAAFRHSFKTSDELLLEGTAGLPIFDDSSTSGHYWQADGTWSRVTPVGMVSLDAQYANFHHSVDFERDSGRIVTVGGSFLGLIDAGVARRLSLRVRVDYTTERDEFAAFASGQLHEAYPAIDLRLRLVRQFSFGDKQALEATGTVTARHGLEEGSLGASPASGSFIEFRPAFSISYSPIPLLNFTADANGQYTRSTVPQQEQFVIGGPLTLRAFAPAVGIGDQGLSSHLEAGLSGRQFGHFGVAPVLFAEYAATRLARRDPMLGRELVRVSDFGLSLTLRYRTLLSFTGSAARPIAVAGPLLRPNGKSKSYLYFALSLKF